MKLYEIKEEFLRLSDMDLDEETLKDTLESLEFDLMEKVDSIACLIKSLEAEEIALKGEVDNLLTRAKTKAKKASDLKEYLFTTLKQLDKPKFETTRNVLSIKKNPVSVILEAGFEIWAETNSDCPYINPEIKYKADKAMIKALIEKGETVPYTRLEQKERLEVK